MDEAKKISSENVIDEAEKKKRVTTRKPAVQSRNPERTRAAILEAARREVAAKGLAGARIDVVARRAGTNKRMIYHYFGDKDALYLAVLEDAYQHIRNAEHRLDLARKQPVDGLRELALFTWHYFLDHPEFLSILATENLNQARYLRQSTSIPEMHSNFISELKDVLLRGEKTGDFRAGLDPVDVYLTIASLGFFYLSNRFTLSTIFQRDLAAPAELERWGQHIVNTVIAALRPF
ncbi:MULTISPECIES: TetR/AcrR family transcriptional regulator [unclassified Rhizobium]|uniref:TetR/AcrR family transcriptional regulator n=1 Tax=unclassified Rhizobium TaxID=2613769 RepID=UPI0017849F28|nr:MULTISPECIES: TetR/AcrR family transcriptional regulator [unclassified Rhizobium]MBD8689443.1 TetR family transcriptional regulator [Rhizobium sp. CFBP 13644]MBD8693798.1 TetR family transcriptional regulator [Rhizobium sp. CFBP 13717]